MIHPGRIEQAAANKRLRIGRLQRDNQSVESVTTRKNTVNLAADRVTKIFGRVANARKRFKHEVGSLRRLEGMEGIPALLEVSEPQLRLVVSRLPGEPLAAIRAAPDAAFWRLRDLVAEMMERGVSRHSMPPRDIIIGPDGQVGLVDFERSTLRWCRYGLNWRVSCAITRYHLLRRIEDFAPHLLSVREARWLGVQHRIDGLFRKFIVFRRRFRTG